MIKYIISNRLLFVFTVVLSVMGFTTSQAQGTITVGTQPGQSSYYVGHLEPIKVSFFDDPIYTKFEVIASESRWTIAGEEKLGYDATSVLFNWERKGAYNITFSGKANVEYVPESGITGEHIIDLYASTQITVIDPSDLEDYFDPEIVFQGCDAMITTRGTIPKEKKVSVNMATVYPEKWFVVDSHEGTNIVSEITNPNNLDRASSFTILGSGTYYIRKQIDDNDDDIYQWAAGSLAIEVDLSLGSGDNQIWWYKDADNDGFGEDNPTDPNTRIKSCAQPNGYVANSLDRCIGETGDNFGCSDSTYSAFTSQENFVYELTPQKPIQTINEIDNYADIVESVNYYDGLGRLKQNIAIKQAPNGKDIAQNHYYDNANRQSKNYLPYVSAYKGGVNDFQSHTSSIEGYLEKTYYKAQYPNEFLLSLEQVNPYVEVLFDTDGASVKKQAAPGKVWAMGNDHEIEHEQTVNVTGDNVYKITATTTTNIEAVSLNLNGFYANEALYKKITKDEAYVEGSNNHTTEIYTNKRGQVVLTRSFVDNAAVDTYNVYDEYGNMRFVLPPNVDLSNGVSTTELANLCYQYQYDINGRVTAQKEPAKAWVQTVYNWSGQPILTQNGIQAAKSPKEWTFSKYDYFGRVVYTGLFKSNATRAQLQTQFGSKTDFDWYEEKVTTPNTIAGTQVYYTNNAAPLVIDQLYTINYYDDYNFNTINQPLPSGNSEVFNYLFTDNVNSLPTGGKVRVLGTNSWISSEIYYNDDAEVVYTREENTYLNSFDSNAILYDFNGRTLKTRHLHEKGSAAHVVVLQTFTYDHAGRLLDTKQCVGTETLSNDCGGATNLDTNRVFNSPLSGTHDIVLNNNETATLESGFHFKGTANNTFSIKATSVPGANTNDYELIASNTYTGIGELTSKKVGNTKENPLQNVKYSRNVRGWLTGINNTANSLSTTADNDLFALTINYNSPTITGSTGLFNGNISETQWRTITDNQVRAYSYSYDALNRITAARSNETDRFTVNNITYDHVGNILSLKRNGLVTQSNSFGVIDNLSYGYTHNKLLNVNDTGSTDGFKDTVNSTDYTYDINGNMVSDANKGITETAYNFLNLPVQTKLSATKYTTYTYDALGNKLKRQTFSSVNAETNTTEYASGFVYEKGTLKHFPTAEGYFEVTNNTNAIEGIFVYHYTDQVGNIRLAYADDDGNGSIATTEIREEKHYYPFGLQHQYGTNDIRSVKRGDTYPYGVNGIELNEDLGVGLYEMPLRSYDPAIARWTTMDPVMHYNYSPYSAFDNNPVYWSDPSGANSNSTGFVGYNTNTGQFDNSDLTDHYWANNGPQYTGNAIYNDSQYRADDFFGRAEEAYNRIRGEITVEKAINVIDVIIAENRERITSKYKERIISDYRKIARVITGKLRTGSDLFKFQAVMEEFKLLLLITSHNDAMLMLYANNHKELRKHLIDTEVDLRRTNEFVGKQISHLHSKGIEFNSSYDVIGLNGKGDYFINYASPNKIFHVNNGIAGSIDGKEVYNPNQTWGLGQDTYLAGWYSVSFGTNREIRGQGLNFIGFRNNELRIEFNNYWKNITEQIYKTHLINK